MENQTVSAILFWKLQTMGCDLEWFFSLHCSADLDILLHSIGSFSHNVKFYSCCFVLAVHKISNWMVCVNDRHPRCPS